MLYFPQLSTGAVSQYPLTKVRLYRTITNVLEDGSRVVLADTNSAALRWKLSYIGLSDEESSSLASFFSSVEGRLIAFTFFDPSSNLLGWSEALQASAWQASSYISRTTSIADPVGTQRATRIVNSSAASVPLAQELNIPGSVTCCFSFYARSDSVQMVTISRSSGPATGSNSIAIGPLWGRYDLAGSLTNGADTSLFEIVIGSGSSLDIFGCQVDAQPAPSQYTPTTASGGIYPSTRFDMDTLTVTSTSPNQNSCELQLVTHVNG